MPARIYYKICCLLVKKNRFYFYIKNKIFSSKT